MADEHYLTREAAQMLQEAGEATLMLVQHALFETLVRQAREESRDTGRHVTPAMVLDRALRMYLEAHGKPEAVDYLHALARSG